MTSSSAAAYGVRIDDRDVAIEVVHRRPGLGLRIDGQLYALVEHPGNGDLGTDDPPAAHSSNTGAFELKINGTTYRGWRYVAGNEVYIRLGVRTFIVSRTGAGAATGGAANQQHELRADMPGVVVAVHCAVGQAVANGDPLLTIESMKLQATLSASHPAVVERVHADIETAFERGALLVSFAKPNAAP